MTTPVSSITMKECPICDGTGKVHSHNDRCWDCRGRGHIPIPTTPSRDAELQPLNDTTKLLDVTKPVQTRGGRKARIICTDSTSEYGNIVALIGSNEELLRFYPDGRLFRSGEYADDLINIEPKTEEWWNLFLHECKPYVAVYKSERDAISYRGSGPNGNPSYFRFIATVKLTKEGDRIVNREIVL